MSEYHPDTSALGYSAGCYSSSAMFRIDLRHLIFWLCLCSVLLTLGNSFYASHQVQRNLLLEEALDNQRVYAGKLAYILDRFMQGQQQELAYSASILTDMHAHPEKPASEVQRLLHQTNHFNAVFLIDTERRIIALQAQNADLRPKHFNSHAIHRALAARQPHISDPDYHTAERWIILHSHPIFDRSGQYLGVIAGMLHLTEENTLRQLLSHQDSKNRSDLYLADRSGQLIYHADHAAIGTWLASNPIFQTILDHPHGAQSFTATGGVDMLAGYASVPSTGWHLVTQQAVMKTRQHLDNLAWLTLCKTLPLLLILLGGIAWLSKLIAQPLWKLASAVKNLNDANALKQICVIKAWYFEASQLKRTLLSSLGSLNHKMRHLQRESTTDALTALLNRRGLIESLNNFTATQTPFVVILIDVDNFKSINDRYGHHMGDGVIRTLASLMRHGSRSHDVLARIGGEEFTMLLPNISLEDAIRAAERLRTQMEHAPNPTGDKVTVSIGVARSPDHGNNIEALLKASDQALYYAKNHGRNLTCVVDPAQPQGLRLVVSSGMP